MPRQDYVELIPNRSNNLQAVRGLLEFADSVYRSMLNYELNNACDVGQGQNRHAEWGYRVVASNGNQAR